MKCHKLAFVMILTAISTPSSYAATYEHSADQISITSVNGGDGDLQTAFDQINGAIGGLSNDDFTTQGRLNALEQAPKAKDGINGTDGTNGKDGADGKDGQNGANGKDGAVGATGAAGLNGTDHHNDVVVQKNTAAVSQNTQRLSNQEMRISTLASQDNQEFANLKAEVDNNQSRSDAGIAGVAAMANIPQVQESQQFAMGAGVGGYGSENALAVGASFHATQNTIVKLTVSNDTQHNFGWGAGTSYGW
ncbi:YadA C-terminal domain-containing protein [Yersinia enterocolitica]|uniref:YadA C-terminal domain-containing protein n=1 Tax=Yersinia enterocolitica TaxID=630 RepID=UPI002962A1CF|nr:YadA C-terminal domain-containing protein [Yersinia enterocolitica]EKN3937141.1 YadA C-terminal domain-containing protein [Yersinia enterocolitica]EKN4035202.1 YadA C-terminal domain-containing protein [Yersinia enterocolitica]EKN4103354.1 YadA C-terminal domain-containing protein [Yersinia enterocolitica]EKN4871779.1 YadA C-terminal domain-containing protein [Yersinia enterocolitica]